jgi:diguanylate cyclase (GGDEF)-like protein
MHHKFKTWQALLITVLSMAVLICFVYFLKIPNPNMILIAGLVICSAFFGFAGGIPAAVIMLGYTFWFFSAGQSGGEFMVFVGKDLHKVFVSIFGITVDMVFVCILKMNANKSFGEVVELTEKLKEENDLLLTQSRRDPLTGIGNRLALRSKFESFISKDLLILMIDIDDFKSINDDHGHALGDEALVKTAKLLSKVFGEENCYRYGGDEFLVIALGMSEDEYASKMAILKSDLPVIEIDGKAVSIGYSAGWERGAANTSDELRKMLVSADAKMYEEKKLKKNAV